ncbi:hypothetical protein AAFC00_003826 [Neodothiora populina]|uniref:Hyphal anastamosis-8 protein n=1 Tax=Neodothiora populina TaxID=2781224 RepID=A0ABR3PFY8_9PEZI
MSANDTKDPTVTARPEKTRTSSGSSLNSSFSSLRTPRVARFAEATSIHSPIEPTSVQLPLQTFATNHYAPQPQPADIGFGYVNEKHLSIEMEETDNQRLPQGRPQTSGPSMPMMSPPLKSAMKTPGAPPKSSRSAFFGPETTRDEEEALEKEEALTEQQQAKDLKVKTRVRIAKFLLRGLNFACSLIVLSMLGATFTIFNATKAIPPRNNLPPWAEGTNPWAQIVLLVISCISLTFAVIILASYCRGGHERAEKVSVYYTVFACGFFVFSIVMWGIGAGILNGAKQGGNSKDLWGWACKDNTRRNLFEADVSYTLVCRLQNWSLVCCVIEIIVETISIAIYGVVFYRFYSKRQLRKSMAKRDTARSDLYLAQLRSRSAPNTPGLNGPYSARDGGWKAPVSYYDALPEVEEGPSESGNVQYVDASRPAPGPKPFVLQPPPIKVHGATPKMQQAGFTPIHHNDNSLAMAPQSPLLTREQQQEHVAAAPGERVYESVPIPGAYSSPINSPTVAPRQMDFPNMEGRV